MRILLTGASGMVGRNLLEHENASAFEVLTPSRLELDLFNFQDVLQYLKHHGPDIIIHAAGRVGGIQANIKEPVKFFLENLDMGRNVVWAAHQAGIRKVLNLGSSCMYPRNAENPLKEEAILKGELEPTNEGYALAKVSVARLCEYINRENPEFQYKTLVPCNLYGRWDKFDPAHSHLIPAVIHKLHHASIMGRTEIDIWGDGLARREFMYAGDLSDCIFYCLGRFEAIPDVVNVGLGYDYTINEYYQAVADVVGYTGIFAHDLSKPVGMKQKVVDISKLMSMGWQAKTKLQEGIANTYHFYLHHCAELAN